MRYRMKKARGFLTVWMLAGCAAFALPTSPGAQAAFQDAGGAAGADPSQRPTPPEGPEITLESLLWDLARREVFAEYPDPNYRLRGASSFDRAATSPDDPSTWFANDDAGHYVRTEERDGRPERVMLDAQGPGVVARIYAVHPTGTLRIYVDDLEEPLIEAPMMEFLSGKGRWSRPLCSRTAQGWACYVPIPFAERCVITHDGDPIAYEIDYRDYPEDAPVVSLTRQQMEEHDFLIKALQRGLALARPPRSAEVESNRYHVEAGETVELWSADEPGMIVELAFNVDFETDQNRELGLRTLVLRIEFDGRETVWCPLGDFLGMAPGLKLYKGWRGVVDETNWMMARWFMPYRESARVTLHNLSPSAADLRFGVRHRPDYEWNERSMYFHADFRLADRMSMRPKRDWNLIEIQGRGVYVGDALTVTNPVNEFWGEGDPKIYVDGEDFPSTFSNGMDDYYGFGNATPQPFSAPFHSRPGYRGPGHYGSTSMNRYRGVDSVPFDESCRVDFGLHHREGEVPVAYAAVAYWYGRPGAESNAKRYDAETLQALPRLRPKGPTHLIPDAIEGEEMAIIQTAPRFDFIRQILWKENRFSQDAHLFAMSTQAGSKADLAVPVEEPGRYRVKVYMTRGPSNGQVLFLIDGQETGVVVDLFNEQEPWAIDSTGPIDLGEWDVEIDELQLRVEVFGTHPDSEAPHYTWGLDAVVLEPVE